jgi:hypothetical protein
MESELPHNDYAISKYGAEMEVWRGQQEGLDVIIKSWRYYWSCNCAYGLKGSGQLLTKVKNFNLYARSTGFVAVMMWYE